MCDLADYDTRFGIGLEPTARGHVMVMTKELIQQIKYHATALDERD